MINIARNIQATDNMKAVLAIRSPLIQNHSRPTIIFAVEQSKEIVPRITKHVITVVIVFTSAPEDLIKWC